jgi:hypothetical protein
MHTTAAPPGCELPRPTDPPVLLSLLIGYVRAGDKTMAAVARGWLAEVGIKVTIANDAAALGRQQTKGGQ